MASHVTPSRRQTPTYRPVPPPRTWRIAAVDVIAVLSPTGIILAMWVRHDGWTSSTLGGQLPSDN